MRTRKLHGLAAATAVGTLALIATASAVGAQEPTGAPRILTPTSQAGVTQGAQVVVKGDGCPPGSTVDIEFDAAPMASTRSDGAGAFSQAITIATTPIDDSLEEAGEAAIVVACGGGRAVVVVGVNPAATDTSAGGSPPSPARAPARRLSCRGSAWAWWRSGRCCGGGRVHSWCTAPPDLG